MSTPVTGVTTVATSARTYAVAGREETLDAVLVIVPLVRAATGRPFPARAAQPSVRTGHPHARARIASGGFLVVAGRPDLVLRSSVPFTTITVELAVPGEPVIRRDFSVPTGAPLPVHMPAWELDDPVRTITGTVRRVGFPFPVVPAATVTAGTGVAGAPFALALRTPLARDHAAGLVVRECTLTAGPVTTLAEPVVAGAVSVVLASSAGIGAGTVLEFGAAPVREHVVVQGPGPDPGQVLLRSPVVHSAPGGAPVTGHGVTLTGPSPVLTRAPRAGDGVLLLDSPLTGLTSTAAVRIDDGTSSEIRSPHAVSDLGGHVRLAGVRNLAALQLTATGPAGTGPALTTAIDPGGGPIIVDLATP
ncbi:hypothetical protein SAMN05421678_12625 [Actinopolymorpha cephalotaxi]|uniref:Uncharacterized protein n=1 Tax=Actinopolymorpha cephalotaxi TaxID=504797 RepID=A0A1I3BSZ7_9ACTN|nr:hypothetical protein [Actinopolymorpha cephalotaxi]NYH83764.1 hypothetical protein [Actinopolymorpha cephalotaxi]SFH64871.1 hypothetical protein SAMN05421678_12625 [Actinopolymorpha cephalotaxi]